MVLVLKKNVSLKLSEPNGDITKKKYVSSKLFKYNKKELLNILVRYKNLYNKGLNYVYENSERFKTMKKLKIQNDIYWFLKKYNHPNFTADIISTLAKLLTQNYISQKKLVNKKKKIFKNQDQINIQKMTYKSNTIFLNQHSIKDIDFKNDTIRFNICDRVSIVSKFSTDNDLRNLLIKYLSNRRKDKYPETQLVYNKNKKTFYLLISLDIEHDVKKHTYTLGIDINRNGMLCVYSTKTGTYEEIYRSDEVNKRLNEIDTKIKKILKNQKISLKQKNIMINNLTNNKKETLKHEINRLIDYILTKYSDHNINIEDMNGMNFKISNKYNVPYKIFKDRMLYKGIVHYGVLVRVVDSKNTSITCPKCGSVKKSNRKGDNFKCKSCGFEDNSHKVAAYNISQK